MNKRGISDVIVTILIVLISIIAVVMVWQAIKLTIDKGTEEIGTGISFLTLDLQIERAEIVDGVKARIMVKRGGGEGQVDKITIRLSNDKESQTYTSNEGLNELEAKTFEFPLEISNPTKAEIYPIGVIEGKEKLGRLADSESTRKTFEDLIAYYPFEGNANDVSGNKNNGVLNGGVDCNANGNIGKACKFDDNDDFIEVADSGSLNPGTITVAAWVYPTADIAFGDYDHLLNKGWNADGSYVLTISLGNQFGAGVGRPSGTNPTTGAPYTYITIYSGEGKLNKSEWQHLAGTYDGATIRIYLDGEEIASREPDTGGNLAATTKSLFIGKSQNLVGSTSRAFGGMLDDVRIYKRALTSDEIRLLAEY